MKRSALRWTWSRDAEGHLQAGSGRAWSPIVGGRLNLTALREPLRARNAGKILVCPDTDLFEGQPFDNIAAVFGVMAMCAEQTFLVTTKHPERAAAFFAWLESPEATYAGMDSEPAQICMCAAIDRLHDVFIQDRVWPLPNVWLGVTARTQREVEERLPALGDFPAGVVHFLVLDPLIESVDLAFGVRDPKPVSSPEDKVPAIALLDWVVVGGDRNAPFERPFHLAWLRSMIQQCDTAGVWLFVERLGVMPCESSAFLDRSTSPWPPHTTLHNEMVGTDLHRVKLRSAHGADMNEWPSDVRRRAFPGEVR